MVASAVRMIAKAELTGSIGTILPISEHAEECLAGRLSSEQAINGIIENQLGRRNITPEEKSYLPTEKKAHGGEHDTSSIPRGIHTRGAVLVPRGRCGRPRGR
jgi:hypothetical protein